MSSVAWIIGLSCIAAAYLCALAVRYTTARFGMAAVSVRKAIDRWVENAIFAAGAVFIGYSSLCGVASWCTNFMGTYRVLVLMGATLAWLTALAGFLIGCGNWMHYQRSKSDAHAKQQQQLLARLAHYEQMGEIPPEKRSNPPGDT